MFSSIIGDPRQYGRESIVKSQVKSIEVHDKWHPMIRPASPDSEVNGPMLLGASDIIKISRWKVPDTGEKLTLIGGHIYNSIAITMTASGFAWYFAHHNVLDVFFLMMPWVLPKSWKSLSNQFLLRDLKQLQPDLAETLGLGMFFHPVVVWHIFLYPPSLGFHDPNLTCAYFSNGFKPPTRVYLCLPLVDFYGFHVGKYTSPMDPMGLGSFSARVTKVLDPFGLWVWFRLLWPRRSRRSVAIWNFHRSQPSVLASHPRLKPWRNVDPEKGTWNFEN